MRINLIDLFTYLFSLLFVNLSLNLLACETSIPIYITSIKNITANSTEIHWSNIANEVNYDIQYRVKGSQEWNQQTEITDTFLIINELQNNTTYEVLVKYICLNQGLESEFSDLMVFSTLAMGTGKCEGSNPPEIPVPIPGGVYIENNDSTYAILHWNPIPDAAGYIFSYGLMDTNPSSWPQFVKCNPANNSLIYGLKPGTKYGSRIRTNCTNCTTALRFTDLRSDWSEIIEFETNPLSGIHDDLHVNHNLKVFPNPSDGSFYVGFNSELSSDVQLYIRDLAGRAVYNKDLAIQYGWNEIFVNQSNLKTGLYFLEINYRNRIATSKILIH